MTIKTRISGPVLWITLNRPDKANCLNRATFEKLRETLIEAESNKAIRAIALTGEGSVFCGGGDLQEVLGFDEDELRSFLSLGRDVLTRFEKSPLIVIAAVNGAARAGGLEIALACDAIVAKKGATLGDAHLANNILPGGGSTVRLPRAIGWQRAKWMILSGKSIDATTAQSWSLVHEVVDDADLVNTVEKLAESMTGAHQVTVGRAKALLSRISEQPCSASLDAELTAMEEHFHSEIFQESIEGFLNGQ